MKLTKESIANISNKFNQSMFTLLNDIDKSFAFNKPKVFEKWLNNFIIENIGSEIDDTVELTRILQKIVSDL